MGRPIVASALDLAGAWCAGHVIGGAPALAHAIKVARTVERHIADAPAELLAAALLHDAPEFAPNGIDLDAVLDSHVGPGATRIIRALERILAADDMPVDPGDPNVLYASAADKIVSLSSVLGRANRADDTAAFWRTRGAFVAQVPHYRHFSQHGTQHLPSDMAAELDALITRAERATAEYR